MNLDVELLLLVVGALLVLTGWLASGRRGPRSLGMALGIGTFAGGLILRFAASWPESTLVLDPISGPLVPLTGLWLAGVFTIMPRRHTDWGRSLGLMAMAYLHLSIAIAPESFYGPLWLLACGATAWALPPGSARRVALPYLGLSAAAGFAGAWVGGATGDVLLLSAVGVRLGVFPFHSWVVNAYERAPLVLAVGLAAPMSALALLARHPLGLEGPLLGWMYALLPVAALFTAGLAIAQPRLTRGIGLFTVSVQSLVLLGMFEANSTGHLGGLLMWAASSVALLGLGLATAAVTSRLGELRLDRHHGLAAKLPTFAWLFLLFGLSAVGAPGTADFVSEDLVLHGELAEHPGVLMLYISAVSLQGYAVLHLFYRVFFGPERRDKVVDATPREGIALAVLAILLVVTGLVPQLLVDGWLQQDGLARLDTTVLEASAP